MTAVGYVGGDPRKVNVDGYDQGDLLAADATGTLVPVAIGTPTQVLTADAGEPALVDWEAGGGGGGGGLQAFSTNIYTGGNISLNTANVWASVGLQALSTIQIAAAENDVVEFGFAFMRSGAGFLDAAVVVAGVPQFYRSSRAGAPLNSGVLAWHPDPQTFRSADAGWAFVVQAGHLDGGLVKVDIFANGIDGTIFCNANGAFEWTAKNLGPVTP